MLKLLSTSLCVGLLLTSCMTNLRSKDNQITGKWSLSKAYNSDGQQCFGLDESKNCVYNKDQTWTFKNDSSFVTKFTSFVNVNFGDTITLTGRYKTYKDGVDEFMEVNYDRFIDSSKIQNFKIIKLTDSTLEYSKRKYDDGSGGMRFIYKRQKYHRTTSAFVKVWLDQQNFYSSNSYQVLFKPTLCICNCTYLQL